MEASTGTCTVVRPAAAETSVPLAYQRMFSAVRYLPLSFALKVQVLPTAALLSLLETCTEAAAKTAVTSRFCLKFVSVRVFLVTPSLHLTKT